MLAALLVGVGQTITIQRQRLNEFSDDELLKLHKKYKGLIRWITSKHSLSKQLAPEFLEKLQDDVVTIRKLLNADSEEALAFILIVASL